jgi:hypothetical protein
MVSNGNTFEPVDDHGSDVIQFSANITLSKSALVTALNDASSLSLNQLVVSNTDLGALVVNGGTAGAMSRCAMAIGTTVEGPVLSVSGLNLYATTISAPSPRCIKKGPEGPFWIDCSSHQHVKDKVQLRQCWVLAHWSWQCHPGPSCFWCTCIHSLLQRQLRV